MTSQRRDRRGQATVEWVLAMPLVALFCLGIAQVLLVARDQLAVLHAAREGARAAAVVVEGRAATERAGRAAALDALALDARRARVEVRPTGESVEVVVRVRSTTDLPLVGPLVPDVEVTGRAVMRRERAPWPG